MANKIEISVEDPATLLTTGMYAAGAIIRLQSASTSGGAYADVSGTGSTPSIPLVAATYDYTGYDPVGVSTTWYRTRYENAGASRLGDWSPVFQASKSSSLHAQLETALRDPTNLTWSDPEIDSLLTMACARMWPKVARRVREPVALVDNQEQYTLTTVAEVNRVDILDSDGNLLIPVGNGAWEFWGDGERVGGTLFINRNLSAADRSLRVHGWAPYDLVSNFPLDRHVQFLLAMARVEACRREITRRSNFTEWQSVNQVQNISTYELILMVNEADTEVRNLGRELKSWRRPVPASVG